nr:PAS domain-containing protein [Desulfobacterales bacterium]
MKSAEEQVILEKMASDFLIQQNKECIVILNPDFTIVKANQGCLRAPGKTKDKVIGAHCYEIAPGLSAPCSSSRPWLGCPMVETLRTRESAHVIHDHPSLEGKSIDCDLVTSPVKGKNGQILQVIRNTERHHVEAFIRTGKASQGLKADLRRPIQEDRMISVLRRLVASCVHEIDNSIQVLLTFSRLVQGILAEAGPGPEKLERFRGCLDMMWSELECCGNIVSGLLSFSRESPME